MTKIKNELEVLLDQPVRTTEHKGERYFSVVDFIRVLTDSPSPEKYWSKLKTSDGAFQPFAKSEQLEFGVTIEESGQ